MVRYSECDGRITCTVKEWAKKQNPYRCKTEEYFSYTIHLYMLKLYC